MLFKILQGDKSRISLDITPFHEGWCYVTTDGGFYVDMNIGTLEAPIYKRMETTSKSAYQIAVQQGFEGDEDAWLESLKGEQGVSGVWTSSEEPPEGYVIQIDPEGDADELNYILSEKDKSNITNQVITVLQPEHEAIDRRISVLENAIANYSKLQVEKVSSLEEMVNPDVIYLIPSENETYYDEYLVFNGVPELIGSTEIDLTNYVTKDAFNQTKLYRHNVLIYYRHVNPELTQVGSDGNFQIAFSLINNDPESYSFKHNVTGTTAVVMDLDCAWQSLRLYRALPQNSRDSNVNYMTSSGFGLICEGTSAPLKVSPCMVNYLLATYYDSNGNSERRFKIHSSKVDGSTIAGAVIQVKCGHPTFDADGNETSLWPTKEEFKAGEYNTYSSYFCQNRIHCIDTVEEISLSTIE